MKSETNRRILRYLICETSLEVIATGTLGEKFETILGVPQDDSLSPILFVMYLESALRIAKEHIMEKMPAIAELQKDIDIET